MSISSQPDATDAMKLPVPVRDNTCAVIVTFNPDSGIEARMAKITEQFGHVVVVDNDSQNGFAAKLAVFSDRDNVTVIVNETNLGVGAALNQGLHCALDSGFHWAVTFDQDTTPLENMLATYAASIAECDIPPAVLGCNFIDENRGETCYEFPSANNSQFIECMTVITSGTLIPLNLFLRIGVFREDYFIDSVDHEFCLRARKLGYRVLITVQPLMSHPIGEKMQLPRWIKFIRIYNQPPNRRYYIARNATVTIADYFRNEPYWCLKQLARLVAEVVVIVFFEEQKPQKIDAFFSGIRDGFAKRMGPRL